MSGSSLHDDPPRSRWSLVRAVLGVVSAVFLLVGVLGIGAHYSPLVSNWGARIAAFSPLLMAASGIGLLCALLGRRWILAVAGVVVVLVSVFTQAPLYFGSAPGGPGQLQLMQANIWLGNADVGAVARTVRERDVDVLTVSELTDEALERISATDLKQSLPYSFVNPRPGGGGIGLFSKYPLSEAKVLDHFMLSNARAVAVIPGHGRYAVYALHPVPPYPAAAWHWASELRRLGDMIGAERLPVLIGGDFNAGYDHSQLRALLTDEHPGLLDAAEHTGSGIVATYPANRAFPALLAIDRVMTRNGPESVKFGRVPIPGSDHHGVIASIRL
ncbi:MAG: endonuclease/exonuclease/phosphatase family protein [Gordonia sp. (in: high G+C Gram-positive bacteria)]